MCNSQSRKDQRIQGLQLCCKELMSISSIINRKTKIRKIFEKSKLFHLTSVNGMRRQTHPRRSVADAEAAARIALEIL